AQGTYTVTLTDDNLCTFTTTPAVTITEPDVLAIGSMSMDSVSCNGLSDGIATANAITGGNGTNTFSWNTTPIQTTNPATGLAAGNYTITVTDSKGCTTTGSVEVKDPDALVIGSMSMDSASCNGIADGTATANTISGGNGTNSFSWTGGSTTNPATGLSAGNYTITVTDQKGCNTTGNVDVLEPDALTIGSMTMDSVSCNGLSDGTATANTITGGNGTNSFSWTGGSTTNPATGLAAGNYTITVTDQKGCSTTGNIDVLEPDALAIGSMSMDSISCNGLSDGTATANSITGGNGTNSFSWNTTPIQTTNPATGLAAGNFIVTVIDQKGCSTTGSIEIKEPDVLAIGSMAMDSVSCNGLLDGNATANSITGGNGTNSFSWNSTPGQITNPATNLSVGSYTITVTDQKGCSTTGDIEVKEPDVLAIGSMTMDSVSCNGLSDGSATANGITGGNGINSFSWNNGQTTNPATNLSAGSYTITVTDQKGCDITGTINVEEPNSLVANLLDTDSVVCNGGSNGAATIDASGGTSGYDVSWTGTTVSGTIYADNPVGIEIANDGDTYTINSFPSGTYNVTVTDQNGCNTTITAVVIEEPPVMTVSTIAHPIIADFQYMGVNEDKQTFCYFHNGTLSWDAGRAKCQLNGGDYIMVKTLAEQTAYNALFGGLSDSRGWIGLSQNESSPLYISTNNVAEAKTGWEWIDGTQLIYDAGLDTWDGFQSWGSGEPNDWQFGNPLAVGEEQWAQFWSQPNPGEFSWNDHRDAQKFYMEIPIGNTINGNHVSCFGGNDGKVAVTAVGGETPYSYSWNTTPTQTTDTAFNLIAGEYIVIVTDNLGCEAKDTVIITEPLPYDISSSQDSVNCFNANDGTASVVVSGGTPNYTYLWDDATAQTTATANNLGAGTYNVLISDDKSCDSIVTIEVLEPAIYDITTSQDSTTCNGDSDGWAEAIVNSGGTGTYTYLWDAAAGNQTTPKAVNLSAGTYSVTISDLYSCDTILNIEVLQPELIIASSNPSHVTCFGGNDGKLLITATGGTNSYNISWAGTASGDPVGFEILTDGGNYAISNLVAGPYQVILTDQNLCSNTIFPTIFQPDQLIVYTSFDSVSCNGLFDGAAYIDSTTGGSIPYTYLWNNGETNDTAVNLAAGTYTVTVTDLFLCDTTITVEVEEPDALLIASMGMDSASCNGVADGTATAIGITGGNGTNGFSWNSTPVQTTNPAIGLAAGNYTVTVTDQKGCFTTRDTTVLEPDALLIASMGMDSASC
ncbi:MAG: hypothetical protein ACKVJK_07660, partial [Methylophagaceae bacterium]